MVSFVFLSILRFRLNLSALLRGKTCLNLKSLDWFFVFFYQCLFGFWLVISTPNGPVSLPQRLGLANQRRVDLRLPVHSHTSMVDPVCAGVSHWPFFGIRACRVHGELESRKTHACVRRALARKRRRVAYSLAAKRQLTLQLTRRNAQLRPKVRPASALPPRPQQAPVVTQQAQLRFPINPKNPMCVPCPTTPRSASHHPPPPTSAAPRVHNQQAASGPSASAGRWSGWPSSARARCASSPSTSTG